MAANPGPRLLQPLVQYRAQADTCHSLVTSVVHASRCASHHARSVQTDQPPCFMPNCNVDRPWFCSVGEKRRWFRPVYGACARLITRAEKCSCLSNSRRSVVHTGAALQRSGTTMRAADRPVGAILHRCCILKLYRLAAWPSGGRRLTQTVGRHHINHCGSWQQLGSTWF
jgi:hypothetical protein